ncbi:MAG: extracellular solute-binding protein [Armatimonadetes bacterium]|nr:extracellular solute-binding protein [Armatimonadota bacterium]
MHELVSTGIAGLDDILGGGLRRSSCTLIEGVPGSGKTTLGLHFLHHGAIAENEPGLVITFEQLPDQIIQDAVQFGMDFDELEAQGMVRIICTSPEVFLDQLSEVGGLVDRMVLEMNAQRLVIDSASHLSQVGDNEQELRSLFYGMINGLKRAGMTTLITKELETVERNVVPFEEYLCDNVVRLDNVLIDGARRRRFIEVLKARGQGQRAGRHTFEITGEGALVFPRYHPPRRTAIEEPARERISTGVSGLDRLLSGGLLKGSASLVAGSAGVGKTTLGLQFVCAGAARNEPAIFVTFEESPSKLIGLASGFGLDLPGLISEDKLVIVHRSPTTVRFDELLLDLEEAIERCGARRLVFDSLTDLEMVFSDEETMREAVYHLTDLLDRNGITSLLTTEVPELFGQTYVSSQHLSIIVDGIILMKYLELESEIQRAISVLKMRGTSHDKGIWRYSIDDQGIKVLGRFEGAEGVMAGAARISTIALSVRSFTEYDEQLNAELLQRFAQMHPNISPVSLNIPYNPDEVYNTVRAALRASTTNLSAAPLCLYWTPDIIREFELRPVDDLLPEEERGEHMPEMIEPAMRDGVMYAVPAIALAGVLLYREDLLEAHGFQAPPATWDELIEQAKTILAGEKNPDLIGYQFPAYAYEGLSTSFLTNLWSNGGDVLDGETCALASEAAHEALQFMRDLIHTHKITPDNMTSAAHGLEPQEEFIHGNTIFLTMLPSVLQETSRPDSSLHARVGIAPPPRGPRGDKSHSFLGGWHYAIPANARAPMAAGEFIRFMTSQEIQKERALRGGPAPTIEALYSDPDVIAFNPHYPMLRQIMRDSKRRHEIPHYLRISQLIQHHLHPVLVGRKGVEETLEKLCARVDTLLQSGE